LVAEEVTHSQFLDRALESLLTSGFIDQIGPSISRASFSSAGFGFFPRSRHACTCQGALRTARFTSASAFWSRSQVSTMA